MGLKPQKGLASRRNEAETSRTLDSMQNQFFAKCRAAGLHAMAFLSIIALCLTISIRAEVINFDDIGGPYLNSDMPYPYAGLGWQNFFPTADFSCAARGVVSPS